MSLFSRIKVGLFKKSLTSELKHVDTIEEVKEVLAERKVATEGEWGVLAKGLLLAAITAALQVVANFAGQIAEGKGSDWGQLGPAIIAGVAAALVAWLAHPPRVN